MKDVTSTSFGLLMAYLLPGLVGLYSFTFWSVDLRKIFQTFLDAEWRAGLFALLLAAALITGLLVGAVRTVLVELLASHFKAPHLSPDSFKKLTNEKFSVFSYVVDENFRYHQFWAGMVLVMPIFFCGLMKESWDKIACGRIAILFAGFAAIELITCVASWTSYQRFVDRAKIILEGGQ